MLHLSKNVPPCAVNGIPQRLVPTLCKHLLLACIHSSLVILILYSSISYQDLWGEAAATSGSQCTQVDSISGSTLAWETSWSWAGGSSSVKSFANAGLNFTPKQLSAISSIPVTWDWTYTGSSIVADVAFDLFTSSTSSGSSEYEIMVWVRTDGILKMFINMFGNAHQILFWFKVGCSWWCRSHLFHRKPHSNFHC